MITEDRVKESKPLNVTEKKERERGREGERERSTIVENEHCQIETIWDKQEKSREIDCVWESDIKIEPEGDRISRKEGVGERKQKTGELDRMKKAVEKEELKVSMADKPVSESKQDEVSSKSSTNESQHVTELACDRVNMRWDK